MLKNFQCEHANTNDLPYVQIRKVKGLGLNLLRVPIRMNGISSKGQHLKCHANVKKIVRKYGGQRLIGHTIKLYDDGSFETYHHSVWVTPEGKAVDICKANVTPDELEKGYILFIPRMIDHQPNECVNEKMHYDFLVKGKNFFLIFPFASGGNPIVLSGPKSKGKKLIQKTFGFSLDSMMQTTSYLAES